MALVTPPKNCDVSVRKAIQQLDKKLGPTSVVTHTNITLTDLTASSLVGTNASKLLESVTIGTSLSYVRPTLNTIQDIRTTDSPTFANLSLGTGELTAGSINRAAGTLTLEIAGTAEISISSTTVTLGGNLVIPDTGYIGSTSDTNAIQIAASGEVSFTDVVTGILPTAGAHLATKEYVDLAIGASADYFLSDNDDAGEIADYHILYDTDTGEAASTLLTAAMGEGNDQLMFSYVTVSGVPGVTFLRNGVYVLHTHLARTTGNRPTLFYWTLSKRLEADPFTETVLMTSEVSSAIPGTMASFVTHAILAADEVINDTDRLVLKLHANVTGGGNDSVITIYMEGTHDCHITNLLPSSIWQNQSDALDSIAALGAIADNEFIVGTGAGTYAHESGVTVRTSLGLAIGTNVQAWDAGLDSLAGLTYAAASFVKMTEADTFVLRTIGETADDLEGTIDHDLTANYVADKHVAHAGVSITAGKGLSGGGTIASTRDIALDLTEMTGNVVWDDGSTDASITWTYALSGANDPVWTIGSNSMDLTTGVLKVGGTTVMLVGGAPTAHVHDGDTLQLDAINSSAGSFAFDTGGLITFNEAITMSAGKDLTIAGHIIFNTNNSYIGFTNPKITFNDTSDRIEITGGLTGTSTAAFAGASVTIGAASTTTGTLVLHDSGSANTITLTVPNALAASLTFTLPPTDGANTNVLQTNGSGVLTWVAAGGGTGKIIQVVNVQDGTVDTGGTLLPNDDSIPQIDEGDEYMTLAITPTSATNKLKIDVVINLANTSAASKMSAALFQDATENALAAGWDTKESGTNNPTQICITHYMDAGTTDSTTFRVRGGCNSVGTTSFNGAGGNVRFGGVMASSITITEIDV